MGETVPKIANMPLKKRISQQVPIKYLKNDKAETGAPL